VKNPFSRLLASRARVDTSLGKEKRPKQVKARDWQQNLIPFTDTGVAHEDFKGRSRLPVLHGMFIIFFGLLFLRLVDLQIIHGEELRKKADVNYQRFHQISPNRGIIYDRYGMALVTNEPRYTPVIETAALPDDDALPSYITRIAELLPYDATALQTRIDEAFKDQKDRIPLQLELDRSVALAILSDADEYPGLKIEITPVRRYVFGAPFAHVLGYIGEISDSELETKLGEYYIPGDLIGRDGVEKSYELYVRGVKGEGEVEIDATGQQINLRVDPTKNPQKGHSLTLTIDASLQQITYEALREGIEQNDGIAGVAIVMDVQTGEVLSLVSYPSYDNNLFSGYLSSDALAALYAPEAGNPLFNRAIAGLYPPGSTFKPFVAAAALEEGIITRSTTVHDPGLLEVGGSRFPCWVYGQYGGSHGSLSVTGALTKSCDVFFYEIGAGYERQAGLGSEKIKWYAQKFGLGVNTAIDIDGEKVGQVPAESDFAAQGEEWYWGNTAHMAIGQGYSLITPLQLVSGTAAIANGGTLYRPHFVKEIQATDYAGGQVVEPVAQAADLVDPAYLAVVREGMRGAVAAEGGTAYLLRDLPVEVAGKTGTAQHDKRKQDHAWFISFAPYSQPRIATVVLVEQGGEGSKAAVPVTKKILQWYFENR